MYFIWRKHKHVKVQNRFFGSHRWWSIWIRMNGDTRGLCRTKTKQKLYIIHFFVFVHCHMYSSVFFCASFENENNKKYIRLWSVSAFELYSPTSCDKLLDVVQKMFHVQCRFCTHRKYIRSFRLAFYMRLFRAWIVFRYRETHSERVCVWMRKCFVSEMAAFKSKISAQK